MSSTKSNALTRNYRGKFGDQFVFRNRNGKSILAMLPKKNGLPPTESQQVHRKRFRLACRYAKNALLDPNMLVRYTEKAVNGSSPYLLAVTDYMKPPEVSEIVTRDYEGNPGDKIHVVAMDDFEITEVTVSVFDPQGQLIEKGTCEMDLKTSRYDYTATVLVTPLTGVVIQARAFDHPAHMGELSVTL
jgi:hypothetical protein